MCCGKEVLVEVADVQRALGQCSHCGAHLQRHPWHTQTISIRSGSWSQNSGSVQSPDAQNSRPAHLHGGTQKRQSLSSFWSPSKPMRPSSSSSSLALPAHVKPGSSPLNSPASQMHAKPGSDPEKSCTVTSKSGLMKAESGTPFWIYQPDSSVPEFLVYTVNSRGGSVHSTFTDVLHIWNTRSEAFASSFSELVHSLGMTDFYFECAPLTVRTAHDKFRFVLKDARRALCNRQASPGYYSREISRQNTPFVLVPNRNGEATIVVPTQYQDAPIDVYGHFGAFIRGAPPSQQANLWKRVHEVVVRKQSAGQEEIWISTDGRDNAWFNVRVDLTPKYFKHPYPRDFGYRREHGSGRWIR